jgi:hypothetical protein
MAPKRRRDVIAKEIPKTYTFRWSMIDISSRQKNRMVGTVRAPAREIVPKPQKNEVVIFRDLLFAVLRFPLHLVIIDILCYFDIYLHQPTPTPSCAFRCICGSAEPRRSNPPPKVSPRRTRSTTNVAPSTKRRGTQL